MRKEDDFSKGKRGAIVPPDPRKTRITIRLDTQILKWFWQRVNEAGGGNYQTMINEALKSYIKSEKARTSQYLGSSHLELDDNYQSEEEAMILNFRGRGSDLPKTRDLGVVRKAATGMKRSSYFQGRDSSMKKKDDTRKVSRDAGTGKFVSQDFAKKNPKTTVTETVKATATETVKKPKKK